MNIDFKVKGLSTFGAKLPLSADVEMTLKNWLPESLNRSSENRRKEFMAGRYCAREAARAKGIELNYLPVAPGREPAWPVGLKGSISHSKKFAVSCVSTSDQFLSVGIDAEEIMTSIVAAQITGLVTRKEELPVIDKAGSREFGISILFSAKEAFYKAIYPLVTTFIDFKEVRMVYLDPKKQVFELELISSNPKLFSRIGIYAGKYQIIEGSVLSLVTINR